MTENNDNPFDMTSAFNTWLKPIISQVWSQMNNLKVDQWPYSENQKGTDAPLKGQAAIASALKNWQTMASAMSSPESMTAILKGSEAMPEMLLQLAQTSMNSVMELHQNLIQHLGRVGDSVEAYKFEDIDENIFRLSTDIYEREFQRFFQIPQLGLLRGYQEKALQTADKFNLFQSNLAEFLRMLGLPFTRSAQVMQEKLIELAERGELSDDTRTYYQMWVKVLEGHFMTLFQTPEYVETLGRTVSSLTDYAAARDASLEDIISILPVARKTDVDDLARELYEMKKRLKRLEKQIGQEHTDKETTA